jgi:hypothetical protein
MFKEDLILKLQSHTHHDEQVRWQMKMPTRFGPTCLERNLMRIEKKTKEIV